MKGLALYIASGSLGLSAPSRARKGEGVTLASIPSRHSDFVASLKGTLS